MDRERFMKFISDYNVNEDVYKLTDNIMRFVEENYSEDKEKNAAICTLFDGTILKHMFVKLNGSKYIG